jgi:hypothetical protein
MILIFNGSDAWSIPISERVEDLIVPSCQRDRTVIAVTERKRPVLVFLGLIAASLAALLLLPPILQDQRYHRFADERTLLGVQNFWNVVSNLPFIVVGAVGLRQFYRDPATLALFLGVFLTGFGSSYYHWNPNDDTLFWDRLPMTLCFMAILTVVVAGLLYAVAKLFEATDRVIHSSFILSGHTLKHLFGAVACFAILRYFQKRQPIA